MFIDSHCHIMSEDFEQDREDCINRAFSQGLTAILDASGGIDEKKISQTAEFCHRHRNIYASVGVHPEEVEGHENVTADDLIKFSAADHIIGIGECGLDFYYNSDTKDKQLKVFSEHIKAAQKTKIPLIIHSREADVEMMDILSQEYRKEKFNGVLHCFSSSFELAEFALSIGFYISASGIITFNKSDELREIFKNIPSDRLLIETDSPYLAPVPFRGKRNEPVYVIKTAEKLAELKNLSVENIAKITSENFYSLFKKAHKK